MTGLNLERLEELESWGGIRWDEVGDGWRGNSHPFMATIPIPF